MLFDLKLTGKRCHHADTSLWPCTHALLHMLKLVHSVPQFKGLPLVANICGGIQLPCMSKLSQNVSISQKVGLQERLADPMS